MPAQNRTYFRNTQTNVGAGGIVYDLSAVVGTGATLLSGGVNSATPTEVFAFQLTTGTMITSATILTGVSINALTANGATIRWRVQRVNSANVVQASSAYSQNETTTGNKTATLTLSTTWAAADRLRLSVELSRSGMNAATVTLNVNSLNSYAEYTYRRIFVIS